MQEGPRNETSEIQRCKEMLAYRPTNLQIGLAPDITRVISIRRPQLHVAGTQFALIEKFAAHSAAHPKNQSARKLLTRPVQLVVRWFRGRLTAEQSFLIHQFTDCWLCDPGVCKACASMQLYSMHAGYRASEVVIRELKEADV